MRVPKPCACCVSENTNEMAKFPPAHAAYIHACGMSMLGAYKYGVAAAPFLHPCSAHYTTKTPWLSLLHSNQNSYWPFLSFFPLFLFNFKTFAFFIPSVL
ncbi:hypothetical protein BX661DRAFT_16016 [Kickxella alabastrina]|uniref:uncharacterized protein n=1 Tax=Kickxella alabastrina TaxID=61397 RepID=UPI00222033B9|nr:uncharacterized protein BX661DRAFT_16016 [Kickxella alabastrina]KAI7818832.1 hypothetical protein BX661DRAFT_16016 [Kickxella alabastrina]